eukprot:9056589-Alexandrium_andersonii.AAC.1
MRRAPLGAVMQHTCNVWWSVATYIGASGYHSSTWSDIASMLAPPSCWSGRVRVRIGMSFASASSRATWDLCLPTSMGA